MAQTDEPNDAWQWLGIAHSHAQIARLDCDPAAWKIDGEASGPFVEHQRRLRKRIWWFCFVRDRHIGLNSDKRLRIRDGDFNVPMLQTSDFDIDDGSWIGNALPASSVLHDIARQQRLAEMCVQMTKLCVIVDRLLVVYSLAMEPAGADTANADYLFARVRQELAVWEEELPESCRHRMPATLGANDSLTTVSANQKVLHMVYRTAIAKLWRPFFRRSQEAQLELQGSAFEVTQLAIELAQSSGMKFLPVVGVGALHAAMITHAQCVRFGTQEMQQGAIVQLRGSMEVITALCGTYAGAQFLVRFFQWLLRKFGVLEALHDESASGEVSNEADDDDVDILRFLNIPEE